MPAPQWTPLAPAVLTSSRNSRALVHDPELGALLFVQGAGVRQRDLWRWTGDALELHASGVFGSRTYSTDLFNVFACHDPKAGDVLLFGLLGHRDDPDDRAPLSGLIVSPLRSLAEERILNYPPGTADDLRTFAAFRLADRLLALADDGTVLEIPDTGDTLTVAAEAIEGLDLERHRLRSAAVDHERGVLVAGTDDDGLLFTWHPETGWREAGASGAEGGALAWDPVDRRVMLLAAKKSGSLSPQVLRPYDDLDADGPALSRFTRVPPLVRVEADGTWLVADRDGVPHVARPGDSSFAGASVGLAPPFDHTDDQWVLTSTPDGPLWAFDTRHGDYARLDGDTWIIGDSDESDALAAATPRGLMILGHDGSLSRVDVGGRTRRLTGPEELVEYRDGDDRLCWDPAAGRLTLVVPEDEETFVFENGAWCEVGEAEFEPEDTVVCGTAAGIYAFGEGELRLWRGDAWHHVGADADAAPRTLFTSTVHGGLWAVGEEGVHVWRDDRFAVVAELPPGVAMPAREPGTVVFFDTRSMVAHDPVADRLLVHGGGGTWTLDLAAVDPGVCELPGVVDGDVVAAKEPETAASCYILEFSGQSVWRTLEFLSAFGGVDAAEEKARFWLTGGPDEAEFEDVGFALELTTTTFLCRLWTVHNGVLHAGLDLAPFVTVRFKDGTGLPATEANHETIWHREGEVVAVELDWDAVTAAVAPLPEPVLAEGDTVEVAVDGFAPGEDSIVTDGTVVRAD